MVLPSVPTNRFLSVSQRFIGKKVNNFWLYDKHIFRKVDKVVGI